MDIGTKLKNARTKSGLTQEKVAEEIGVSRQSVSNWENGRSYPDIVSVIKLSDLYSVSLDELLKEDKKMIDHLDEATNTVASRKRFMWLILIGVYLLIWTAAVMLYHVVAGIEGVQPYEKKGLLAAYVIGVLYLAIPVISVGIAAALGHLRGGWTKWLFCVAFGMTETLALLVTIGAEYVNTPEFGTVMGDLLIGAFISVTIASAVGMGIGTLIQFLKNRKKSGNTENDNSPGRAGA